jgi:hypothetical protein
MCAITKVQTNQKFSKSNEKIQLHFYGNYANLLGEKKHIFV